jgi:hypothetical protein
MIQIKYYYLVWPEKLMLYEVYKMNNVNYSNY